MWQCAVGNRVRNRGRCWLISVIYAWVVLEFGSSFVRIILRYFMIYAHISSIMLGFGFFGFFIVDLHIWSQVLGEKHKD